MTNVLNEPTNLKVDINNKISAHPIGPGVTKLMGGAGTISSFIFYVVFDDSFSQGVQRE